MSSSRIKTDTSQRQGINRSLLLRVINDTIDKIRTDSALLMFPSREEMLTTTLANYLERAGISLECDEDNLVMDPRKRLNDPTLDLPLNLAEINVALDAIPGLTVVEKVIFADDLQQLERNAQEEFLAILKQNA